MRAVALPIVLALALAGGTARAAGPAEAELINLEAQWSKASVANDATSVASILAADWTGQNSSGKVTTRAQALADMKSGKSKTAMMKNRDVRVRIMGDVAVVQGADDEKSSYDGKDTSGAYTWTDVFQKRGGHWVAVNSQVTKVDAKK